MPFKIKDLMIDVTSIPKACIGGTVCNPTFACHFGTCGHCSVIISFCGFNCSYAVSVCACSHFGSACPTGSIACPGGSIFPTTTPYQVEIDPAVLKAQLQAALTAVEEREKQINDSLMVKTLADAELLEGKLSEALDEVKRMKKTLK